MHGTSIHVLIQENAGYVIAGAVGMIRTRQMFVQPCEFMRAPRYI
jgi:hypothetical protein